MYKYPYKDYVLVRKYLLFVYRDIKQRNRENSCESFLGRTTYVYILLSKIFVRLKINIDKLSQNAPKENPATTSLNQ